MTYAAEPHVAAYLRDLATSLDDAPATKRAEVVGAVSDHVDTAVAGLGHPPTTEDLQGILADLGPVDDVAASWSLREKPPEEPEEVVARPRRSVTDRPVGVLLVGFSGLALALALLPISAALGWGAPATMLFVTIVAFLRSRKDEEKHRAGWRTVLVLALPATVVTLVIMIAAAMATVADANA